MKIEEEERSGNSMAFISADTESFSSSKQESLPLVSVILAVKGVGEQGMANWRSQLVTLYGGPVEFLFCMESNLDPAYEAVSALKKEMAGIVEIKVVVAGLSSHCSQQIHNQLAGAKAVNPASKYILLLDDDIQCHPGTIGSLVDVLENKPEVFVATGYSFDVPSQPTLGAYAAMAYRLPLLVGMSSGSRVFFVWGGCIFFRTGDFRSNKHGMKTALEQNGYSNDLILTSIAGQNNRTVYSPAVAIFPGRMSGDWNLTRYWNYVRRQIFALLTYCSSYAYRVNRVGWVIYMYLSWACIIPLFFSLAQISQFLASALWALVCFIDKPFPVPGFWNLLEGAVSLHPSPVCLTLSLTNLVSAFVLFLFGLNLFNSVLSLCNKLSPEAPKFQVKKLSLGLSIAGMALNLVMLPVIAMYTYFRPDISWARIRYVRKNGVVAKVTHPGEAKDVGIREVQQLPGGTVLVAKILAVLHQGGDSTCGNYSVLAQTIFNYFVKSWSQRMRRTKVG